MNAISSRQISPPHRSVPIFGIDANEHVGMMLSRDTRSWFYTDSENICTFDAEKENKMGTVFRSSLEKVGILLREFFFHYW